MAVCLEYQAIYCERRAALNVWWLTLSACVLLLLALGLKVWIKIEATAVGYELAAERSRAVALDMERREAELQLSVLMRHDRLAEQARARLQLGALSPKQARRVRVGG